MTFEITSTGRLCTELLGKVEPDLRVPAHAFDYDASAYVAVPDGLEHLLVFTSGSVEQDTSALEAGHRGSAGQGPGRLEYPFRTVGWPLPGYVDRSASRHKERWLSLGYDENLWALLSDLEEEGRMTLDRTIVNIFGKLRHPTSPIERHKTA